MSDELKDVKLRLERLEEKVSTVGRQPRTAELNAEDIAAFHRVQNAFWEDGTCGINETSPCVLRCNIFTGGQVVPIPKPCDIECTCGPCNIFGSVLSQAFRFRGLGL